VEHLTDNTKLFTDPLGKFQMVIPVDWQYKNPSIHKGEPAPHSFELYERPIGTFQVRCEPLDEETSQIIARDKLEIQNSDYNLLFDERFADYADLCGYMWLCAVDDHFITITYTYEGRLHGKSRTKREFLRIRKVLNSIRFIKPTYRDHILAIRRYNLFMGSIVTSLEMKIRAQQNGAFIEVVVLAASRIDALLRLAIILTVQLENKSEEIDTSVLYQDSRDRPVSERQIYKRALEHKVIGQDLFDKLELLYKERNRVVHQFIITDILTEDLLEISHRYDEIDHEIGALIDELEYLQYEAGTGMFTNEDKPPGEYFNKSELKKVLLLMKDKHGYVRWKQEVKVK
jgi:hypothetical protein